MISVAGNDTTKQTTSLGMLALQEHPDQRDWLSEDFDGRIGQATEELVRYVSPVIQFARTATQDTELAGARITAGDKVVLFYCSGNRDESTFPDPAAFDLSRRPNPHVGFGGGGAHYCLGNGVAKIQLRALFKQLLAGFRRSISANRFSWRAISSTASRGCRPMSAEAQTKETTMFVILDRDECTGLGICESISAEHFEIDDEDRLVVLRDTFDEDERELMEDAVRSCPTAALRIAATRP